MLYICATPIGNLDDLSLRALNTLKEADIILCEDTRNSQKLFSHYNINYKKLVALHMHNEAAVSEEAITWLLQGLTVVLITDAGTPGISDPGARLCAKVLNNPNLALSPIPGASAFAALLSVSGIDCPCLFYGFLPSTKGARRKQLSELLKLNYAICLYEAPHRIVATLTDLVDLGEQNRTIIFGRELTKHYETILRLNCLALLSLIKSDNNQERGEIALIILPKDDEPPNDNLTNEQKRILTLLVAELPLKKAVNLTHAILEGDKDQLYSYGLTLKNSI